eukprot:8347584-Pyramimonas_sp.AAC.1
MATVVSLMCADLGAKAAPVYFAADAMGAGDLGHGGWGAPRRGVTWAAVAAPPGDADRAPRRRPVRGGEDV